MGIFGEGKDSGAFRARWTDWPNEAGKGRLSRERVSAAKQSRGNTFVRGGATAGARRVKWEVEPREGNGGRARRER